MAIRNEAMPLAPQKLSIQQKEAVSRIKDMLLECLGKQPPKKQDEKDSQQNPSDDWLQEGTEKESLSSVSGDESGVWKIDSQKRSQLAFLSGKRGSGKSTVLVSLKKLSEKREKRIIWLQPLDLEPLPDDVNLIVALLLRIEDAYASNRPKRRSGEASCSKALKAERDFNNALENAALSWRGGVSRWQPRDPDTYKKQVLRVERARLKSRDISGAIEGIAKQYMEDHSLSGMPLFVMTIDDVDLDPTRAIELLQLIRSITSPYLFFFMAGHFERLQNVAELDRVTRISHRFKGLPDVICAEYVEQIRKTSRETAAATLVKILPQAQRIILKGFNRVEGAKFTPPKSCEITTLSLGMLLNKINIHPHNNEKEPFQTAWDLLSLSSPKDVRDHTMLTASIILEQQIRPTYDLWMMLKTISKIDSNKQPKHFINFCVKEFIKSIDLGKITTETAGYLKGLIREFNSVQYVDLKNIASTSISSRARLVHSSDINNATKTANALSIGGHRLVTLHNSNILNFSKDGHQLQIDQEILGWLALISDLTRKLMVIEKNHVIMNKPTIFIETSIFVHLPLPWPNPRWVNHYHIGKALSLWDQKTIPSIFSFPKMGTDNESGIRRIFYLWITSIDYHQSKSIDDLNEISFNDLTWSNIFDEIMKGSNFIWNKDILHPRYNHIISLEDKRMKIKIRPDSNEGENRKKLQEIGQEYWPLPISVIFAPEYALPESAAVAFLETNSMKKIIENQTEFVQYFRIDAMRKSESPNYSWSKWWYSLEETSREFRWIASHPFEKIDGLSFVNLINMFWDEESKYTSKKNLENFIRGSGEGGIAVASKCQEEVDLFLKFLKTESELSLRDAQKKQGCDIIIIVLLERWASKEIYEERLRQIEREKKNRRTYYREGNDPHDIDMIKKGLERKDQLRGRRGR